MGKTNTQPTKVITGKVRFSYVNIFKSRALQELQQGKKVLRHKTVESWYGAECGRPLDYGG